MTENSATLLRKVTYCIDIPNYRNANYDEILIQTSIRKARVNTMLMTR